MGIFNGNDNGNPLKIAKKIGKIGTKLSAAVTGIITVLKLMPLIIAATIVGTLFSFVVNVKGSEKTAEEIYKQLEIEDVSELVEIKENSKGEYYIDFKEDSDKKLDEIVEYINNTYGTHNVPADKAFLKELFKAELITKFPNLGGDVPEDSNGFQGGVNLRRISPNKEIGELKSVGKGESSNVEQEETQDPNENVGEYEALVKTWEKGQELYTNVNAVVYEQTESKINPGSDTGNWEFAYNKENKKIVIDKGTKVTYTGTYKSATNALSKVTTTYVEVKTDTLTGFVKAQNLSTKSKQTSNATNSQTTQKQYAKVSSRAKGTKTMGDTDENYIIAIVPAYSGEEGLESGDLKEKELTKQVANKVENLCQDYSNIKIVQTENSIKSISDAEPDMVIAIYFNASQTGNESGVDAIYKEGDEVSHLFADVLADNISKAMELENLSAGEDGEKLDGKTITSIESYRATGYPSVITRGGYLNNEKDAELLRADGTDKYAQGIVKAIEEYIKANKEGYVATEQEENTVQKSIESKVIKMKYVPEETFKQYVEKNDEEALKVFTMNKDFQILTATWGYEDGKTEITENVPMDFRTALQKYVMPYEYLLFFYTDADYEDFSLDLAKKVQETEVVIALQDNVITTKQVDTTIQKKSVTPKKYQAGYGKEETSKKETKTETVNTSIEITYVNTWFVKAYKESSYSEDILNIGDKDKVILDLRGTASKTQTSSKTSEKIVEKGTQEIPGDIENGVQTYINAHYTIKETTETETETYNHQYDSGEAKVDGKENVFVDLYQSHNMIDKISENRFLQIIEDNEKTVNLLDLTKYLMWKATSEDFDDIVEYDFGQYSLSSFSGMTGLYGDTVEENVWFALRNAGYSEIATAAVMGNIKNESGFETDKIEGGSGIGFGLCQWSFGRRTKIEAYAKSKGTTASDLQIQIEFLLAELTPGGGANGYASYQMGSKSSSKYDGKRYTRKDWTDSKDLDTATMAFMAIFERPSFDPNVNHISRRRNDAKKYYETFKGRTAPTADSRIGKITLSGDNANKMLALLTDAIKIADDDRYTYSQGNRYGEFQYDCSSFVYRLYKKHFGITVPTSTTGYGTQYRIGREGSVQLQPGDVLWRSGHVEIYLGNGQRVGAHGASYAIKDQISVKTYKPGNFTYVYRFVN